MGEIASPPTAAAICPVVFQIAVTQHCAKGMAFPDLLEQSLSGVSLLLERPVKTAPTTGTESEFLSWVQAVY